MRSSVESVLKERYGLPGFNDIQGFVGTQYTQHDDFSIEMDMVAKIQELLKFEGFGGDAKLSTAHVPSDPGLS